jgi:hypothetical protein
VAQAAAESASSAASDSADAAEDWAIRPEDDPVPVGSGGDGSTTYSALHWAAKAAESAASASGIASVVEDTTPQLGGDLDLNGHVITGLEIGTDVQAYSANLDAWSALDPNDYATYAALGSTSNALGAALIGIEDSGGHFTATTVEAALAELFSDIGALSSVYQPLDSDLTIWAGLTPSANAQSLVTATNYAAMRALLDLEAGTDFYSKTAADAAFQPLDSDLTSIAALSTTAAGRSILTFTDPNANAILYWDDSDGAIKSLTLDDTLEFSGDNLQRAALTGAVAASAGSNTTTSTFDLVIPMGGTALATGIIKGVDVHFDFAATIVGWTLLGDQSGSLVIDIWKDTYANFAPTVADTITASAKPTISSATKGQSSSLTGWTTSISAGDVLRFNVDSVTSIVAATLILKMTKTS